MSMPGTNPDASEHSHLAYVLGALREDVAISMSCGWAVIGLFDDAESCLDGCLRVGEPQLAMR
jgi:hypothetical protein